MSYTTSLLMAYPPPYGSSTLLSDELVQRSSLGNFYESSVPYMNGNRLLSDNLTYNQRGLGSTTYRLPVNSQFPSTNYRTPSITNWRRDIPPNNSYNSLNEIREYSESLGTTSNTTTATSIAHSINENNLNGSKNIFSNYQSNYNRLLNDVDRSPYHTTVWNSSRPKISTNDEKLTPTYRSLPELLPTGLQKKSPIEKSKNDITPIPSPPPPPAPIPPAILTKQETNLQRNPTLIDGDKQQSSLDVQAWINKSKDETPLEEKTPAQAWTGKIDRLHMIQAQREKEKAKLSRALPIISKKVDNNSTINKAPTANDIARRKSFQMRNESYFDTLFDGNFLRRTSTYQSKLNSSYQQPLSTRNQSTTNLFNKPKTTILSKHAAPRKVSQYEPPSINRAQPMFNNNSSKKQPPKQNQPDSTSPRENIFKEEDGRFREALQKFRSDRAEQQQRESNESTAKRLHYGEHVRRLTKDDLLHNVIKPSPWSDFMDLKKGNLYSLTKEEKKELYNQSRSYGERIRHRNFALHLGGETARTQHRSLALPILNQEPESGDETSHQQVNDDDNNSKLSKRSDSNTTVKTTNKTFTKHIDNGDITSNQSDRSTMLTDRSSMIRPSEEDDEDVSDFESSRKQKKNLHYSKYDSSTRTTSGTEESGTDETSEQRSYRIKSRDTYDDLFTVREEKTLESLEGARYKKR